MARSLGLAAYRALARRGEASDPTPQPPRPAGELAWLHAGEPGNLLAVHDLAQRLTASREGLSVLITLGESGTSPTAQPPAPTQDRILQVRLPSDHPTLVKSFLDHWRPGLCLWVWGGLMPNLILEASDRRCPMFLIDADTAGVDRRKSRWLPDLTRQVLARFNAVFARTAAGQKRLIQLGLSPNRVALTSPLLAGGQALTCDESDLAELSAAMGGRPAWFATNLLPTEIATVLSAHAQASRLSHRLLLILQPAPSAQAGAALELAQGLGMQVARWDEGVLPDEMTQVLIAADPDTRGLFFRLAPVCFLGATLVAGDEACDPLDAAALGSAILYGPRVRHYTPSYSRLVAAGAARIVNDASALGTAVSNLIAPDHAATMAHAGWDVISQGAALTDRVIELVQDTLDDQAVRP